MKDPLVWEQDRLGAGVPDVLGVHLRHQRHRLLADPVARPQESSLVLIHKNLDNVLRILHCFLGQCIWLIIIEKCWPIFFILMDTKHFKMDFSINLLIFLHFLHSPTIHSLKTVLYLLSFEAFNDSMYSTNMVSSDFSPGIRQPRYYIQS